MDYIPTRAYQSLNFNYNILVIKFVTRFAAMPLSLASYDLDIYLTRPFILST